MRLEKWLDVRISCERSGKAPNLAAARSLDQELDELEASNDTNAPQCGWNVSSTPTDAK